MAEELEVVYPDEFTLRPFDIDVRQSEELLKPFGGSFVEAPPLVQGAVLAKLRRAIERDVGHIPLVRDILNLAKSAREIEGIDKDDKQPTEPTEPTEPAQQEGETSEETQQKQAETEEVLAQLKVVEGLVKATFPDSAISAVAKNILEKIGVLTPEIEKELKGHQFKWYTAEVAEIQETGETTEEIREEENKEDGQGKSE
jgi:hypothetical protein